MSREEARTVFTKDEIAAIEALVRQRYSVPSDKQKGICSKIRRIGMYWSEVAGRMSYTVENLHRLINDGVIKVVGLKPTVTLCLHHRQLYQLSRLRGLFPEYVLHLMSIM